MQWKRSLRLQPFLACYRARTPGNPRSGILKLYIRKCITCQLHELPGLLAGSWGHSSSGVVGIMSGLYSMEDSQKPAPAGQWKTMAQKRPENGFSREFFIFSPFLGHCLPLCSWGVLFIWFSIFHFSGFAPSGIPYRPRNACLDFKMILLQFPEL